MKSPVIGDERLEADGLKFSQHVNIVMDVYHVDEPQIPVSNTDIASCCKMHHHSLPKIPPPLCGCKQKCVTEHMWM